MKCSKLFAQEMGKRIQVHVSRLLVAGMTVGMVFHALASVGSGGLQRVPLVDFKNRQDADGATGRSKKRSSDAFRLDYDANRGCVVCALTNETVSLSFSSLNQTIRNRRAELKPKVFYVVYRSPDYDACIELQCTAEDSMHAAYLSVARCEEPSVAKAWPEFGYHSKGEYDPLAIDGVRLRAYGSGRIEVYEIGVVPEEDLPCPVKRDSTPIDPMSFAVVPEPREWRLSGGEFILPKSCEWESGDLPPAARADFVRELREFHDVTLCKGGRPRLSFALVKELGPVKDDGFAISVTSQRVEVRALEPAGLAYASMTLAELIWRAGGERIPCFELKDWPRFRLRPWLDATSAFGHQNRYEIPFYLEQIRRFVLGARVNRIALYMDSYFKWRSPALQAMPPAWSRQDFEEIVDYANGYGVRMLPTQQSLGHQKYFFCRGEGAKRFGEDGDGNACCTRNPEYYPVLFDTYDELIEMCSRDPSCRPDYFLTCHDEVQWKTESIPASNRCVRCAGVPKNRIFLEDVKRCDDFLRSRGLKSIIYTDMIAPSYNGYDPYHCGEIASELPRSVVLASWAVGADVSIKGFADMGFENWKLSTGFNAYPYGDGHSTALGLGNFTCNWWLSRSRGGLGGRYGVLASRLMGCCSWGIPGRGKGDDLALAKKYGAFLMRGWSRKPMPNRGREMPVKFVRHAQEDRLDALQPPADAVGLVFTHTVDFDTKSETAFPYSRGDPTLGPRVATCTVRYEDGTTADIPMHYGWNVGDFRLDGTKSDELFSRYLADCREIIVNEADTEVRYVYEWANPHQEKRIAGVSIARDKGCPPVYRLFAVSAICPKR